MAGVDIQTIKQRFGIIGNSPLLNREIEKALLIAPTDLTVLITGESGVGKEVFPQTIHQNSMRKHGSYIAVNCGAIPEGTIDSELFGHEKGSFTGALAERKGYFEVADKGTIFLDEVGELPMATQARLLRVLEYGEFIKVGSSKVQKTDVRIVAATNVDLLKAIRNGKFREDLYYRLNTVPINIPPLRERKEDIYLLFRKFASDFAEKYRMPPIHLTEQAREMLVKYRWPGNIRELKNVTERMSIFEQERTINLERLKTYLSAPDIELLPAIISSDSDSKSFANEREILYQILFDMKKDINELKKLVPELVNQNNSIVNTYPSIVREEPEQFQYADEVAEEEKESEPEKKTMSLEEVEKDMIQKALERHNGKRRSAAQDLKISERTLYRKIKEYGMLSLFIILFSSILNACSMSYSFQGGRLNYDVVKTITIQDFPNRAALVEPSLSHIFDQALRNRFIEQTRLVPVPNNGDIQIEGEITGYDIQGMAVREDAFASQTRLTITVRVIYTNNKEQDSDIDQSFSSFREYPSDRQLQDVQDGLIREIVSDLIDMIYNATVGNW